MKKNRKGLMLVLSSPSGAGKTSICKEILKKIKELNITVLKSITAIKVIKITKPELTRNDSEFKSLSILIIGNSNC